jgi:hypothetical protein
VLNNDEPGAEASEELEGVLFFFSAAPIKGRMTVISTQNNINNPWITSSSQTYDPPLYAEPLPGIAKESSLQMMRRKMARCYTYEGKVPFVIQVGKHSSQSTNFVPNIFKTDCVKLSTNNARTRTFST